MQRKIIILSVLLTLYIIYQKMIQITSPTGRNLIRNDKQGSGSFMTKRSGHDHQGIDLIVLKDAPILAPISGLLIREAIPYPNDLTYRGCVIKGAGVFRGGYEIKMFYMKPIKEKIGQLVNEGELIGYAQAISGKYGGGMIDHIHLELRIKGKVQNPILFLKNFTI